MKRRCCMWLFCVAALAGSSLSLAQHGPELAGIEFVRLGVSDLERSRAFYVALFGDHVVAGPDAASHLQLGGSELVLQPAAQAGVLQQGVALAPAALGRLRGYLDEQGIRWQDADAGSIVVRDGDAVETRLAAAREREVQAAGTAAVFEPLLIDELSVTVSNMQVDSMFYARLLGQTSTAVAGVQFFRVGNHARVRLSQAAVGQPGGFNYFSVLVANTDMDAAAEAVFRAGGVIENFLANGFSFWDPDGLRVVVRGAPLVLDASAAAP